MIMDEFSDYLDKEEQKLLAKQAKCLHDFYFVMIKCKKCGSVKSEKEEEMVACLLDIKNRTDKM